MPENRNIGTIWEHWKWPPSKKDFATLRARKAEYERRRARERAQRSWWEKLADLFLGL